MKTTPSKEALDEAVKAAIEAQNNSDDAMKLRPGRGQLRAMIKAAAPFIQLEERERCAKVADKIASDNNHVANSIHEDLTGGFIDVSEAETLAKYEGRAEAAEEVATGIRQQGEVKP